MNKYTYRILDIKYSTLSNFGEVFVVYANRALESMLEFGSLCFNSSRGDDTELFVYPQDMGIIDPVNRLCQSGKPWEPNMNEFRDGGLTLPDNKRHIAHYHETLYEEEVDEESPAIINYKAEEITFNNRDWIKFDEPQDWELSINEIRTPYGDLEIEGYMMVEQNGLVGVQLEVCGELYFGDIPAYPGEDDDVFVKTVAVMRQPNNVWLWLYLFDENHNPIASISGLEGDIMANELTQFVTALKKSSRYSDQ